MSEPTDERYLNTGQMAELGNAAFEAALALLGCLHRKGMLTAEEITEILLHARQRVAPDLQIVEQRLNLALHDLLIEPNQQP